MRSTHFKSQRLYLVLMLSFFALFTFKILKSFTNKQSCEITFVVYKVIISKKTIKLINYNIIEYQFVFEDV